MSGVTFNGTASTFTVVSASSITATVPGSATSGAVVVTTPYGSATCPGFTVTTGAPNIFPTTVVGAPSWPGTDPKR